MGTAMKLTTWSQTDVTQRVLESCRSVLNLPSTCPEDLIAIPNPDPEEFQDAESFRDSYWRAEVWSKYPFEIEGIDREEVAHAKFFEAEERCSQTNRRLCDLWNRPIPERYRSILRHAASLLEHLFAGFTVDEIAENVGWGPGASTSMRRAQATPQNKWVFGAHCTEGCLPYFYAFQRWSGWVFDTPVVVDGNKVTTVPKNAKTDRVIAIEPDWNSFFQIGLGRAIRSRLQRRFGLLRRSASDVNRILARKGSVDGFLATIDLSSASDTLSLGLIEALLPRHVLPHVLNLRSPKGRIGDTDVTYEKVSSMGNGYTFELETAVFYCICRAAAGHATVFGDDIIVPSATYQLVSDVLEFCGFEVNTKKSFYRSAFRESCGGHFFGGVDVTPPYVRKPLKGPRRIAFANRISELCDNGYWRRGDWYQVHRAITAGIPRAFYGPKGVDGVVHCNLYESRPEWSSKYQCFKGLRVVEEFFGDPAVPIGAYIQALHGTPGHTQWQRPPGQPKIRIRTWYGHWQGISPWAFAE